DPAGWHIHLIMLRPHQPSQIAKPIHSKSIKNSFFTVASLGKVSASRRG
ncbi:hypothetical protein AAULR_12050, partial [Lacticaseibacillus rhamnosus MTCC 5462]